MIFRDNLVSRYPCSPLCFLMFASIRDRNPMLFVFFWVNKNNFFAKWGLNSPLSRLHTDATALLAFDLLTNRWVKHLEIFI